MRHLSNGFDFRWCVLLAVMLGALTGTTANAALTVVGTQYQQDDPLTEYQCYWHYNNYPTSCGGTMTGCNVHVYLKNTGGSAVTVSNVTLAGYSLSAILKQNTTYHSSNSIFYYWDDPPQAIFDAGEPVWFKADPKTVPAGGFTNVVVRLRWVPVTQPISIGVIYTGGTTAATVAVDANAPQLASVTFSSDRKKVYLSWRRSGGAGPTTIKMDDVDVTAYATTVSDANCNYAVSVLTFETALANMSYHVYQGIYSDGKTATGSLPTWVNPFIHCTWGAKEGTDGDTQAAKNYIDDATNRFVNTMEMTGSNIVNALTGTSAGRQYCTDRGFGFVFDQIGDWSIPNPRLWFLDDEPDNEDANIEATFCGTGLRLVCGRSSMGIVAMREIATVDALKAWYLAPTTINVAGAYKPECFYAYGQLSDVYEGDPYYQGILAETYWYKTRLIPLFNKAMCIYATSLAMCKAAEPNPHRILLNSIEYRDPTTYQIWPFADPGCKRMEAYYALAGGAKGLGYWWFKTGWPYNGLGDGGPEATALWREIGLYGNEIKTIQPQIVTSTPVAMTVTPSANVWARALTQGTDTVILYAVNDNYYNDETLHYTAVANANVVVSLPSWMTSSPSAFEVRASGLYDITTSLNGNNLTVQLGTLNLTKMIVITTNANLRSQVQARYINEVWPKVCAFASDHCVPQNAPPSITSQPVSTMAGIGESAAFSVSVTGSTPLYYQWRKNGANLSGATSITLTLSNIQASDEGNYRCVVSNSYGSATSNEATLTIGTCIAPTLTNGTFEASTVGNPPFGWTTYIESSKSGGWVISSVSPPQGSQWQQTQVYNAGAYGGVRQNVSTLTSGTVYTISGSYRTNSTSATASVRYNLGGNTDRASSTVLASTASTDWGTFSGTVTALGTSLTLFLDHMNGTSTNKASAFDNITVTGCGASPAPIITQHPVVQSFCPGTDVSFVVAATGSGALTYLWQKNSANLSNGGHYSGVSTATLVISTADSNDAANYRCVVSNASGSATSNQAALTMKQAVAADLDDDCDVDQADINIFMACASGPTVPVGTNCESSDLDYDNDVDQSDFGILQRCYSGEDIPVIPGCTN